MAIVLNFNIICTVQARISDFVSVNDFFLVGRCLIVRTKEMKQNVLCLHKGFNSLDPIL